MKAKKRDDRFDARQDARMDEPLQQPSGFSLIELIVVITIIGILASVVVVNVSGRDDQAKHSTARAEVQELDKAVELYKMDLGQFPNSIDDLLNPPEGRDGTTSNPYMKKRPKDPWTGEDYIFEPDDRGVLIMCFGADREEGGEGINADISNRDEN